MGSEMCIRDSIDAEEENMINAFPKSRCVAWTGGAVLGAAAGISAWLYMAGRAASLFNRAIVALLAAFIAVNIALYIARLMAAREYQKRLLLLYEALDPSAFLQALLPLRKKRMDASNRCTTLVHIANGYLYGGQPQQALAVLEDVQPPEKALEMRGLVAGNKATCFLAAGEMDRAQTAMDELRRIAADRSCKKEFVQNARERGDPDHRQRYCSHQFPGDPGAVPAGSHFDDGLWFHDDCLHDGRWPYGSTGSRAGHEPGGGRSGHWCGFHGGLACE